MPFRSGWPSATRGVVAPCACARTIDRHTAPVAAAAVAVTLRSLVEIIPTSVVERDTGGPSRIGVRTIRLRIHAVNSRSSWVDTSELQLCAELDNAGIFKLRRQSPLSPVRLILLNKAGATHHVVHIHIPLHTDFLSSHERLTQPQIKPAPPSLELLVR